MRILFCGDPFLFHESCGLTLNSSSSTSGVAVGTVFPVIDVVSVGVVTVILEVVACPKISGFKEPPDIAESVSSFSSLHVMRQELS